MTSGVPGTVGPAGPAARGARDGAGAPFAEAAAPMKSSRSGRLRIG